MLIKAAEKVQRSLEGGKPGGIPHTLGQRLTPLVGRVPDLPQGLFQQSLKACATAASHLGRCRNSSAGLKPGTTSDPMTIRGKVYLIGAGPGDVELLTVKASRLLQSADVVLHDLRTGPADAAAFDIVGIGFPLHYFRAASPIRDAVRSFGRLDGRLVFLFTRT